MCVSHGSVQGLLLYFTSMNHLEENVGGVLHNFADDTKPGGTVDEKQVV